MTDVGLFGGTFSPIHMGHVAAADGFYDALGLQELLVVPAYLTPRKVGMPGDDPIARLEMVRLAFREDTRQITVSDFEIARGRTTYTYQTLRHFASPDIRLTFLCGTDAFLSLDRWRHPEILFSLARIAHVRREALDPMTEAALADATERYCRVYGGEVIHLSLPPQTVSSSEVRRLLEEGGDASSYLPPAVSAYIAAHRLYGHSAAGGTV